MISDQSAASYSTISKSIIFFPFYIVEMPCFEIFILHLISSFINGGSFLSTIMTLLLAKFVMHHSVYLHVFKICI